MADTVTVDVSEGTLRGRKAISKNGKPYHSFQGVPYAKPPIGALRFEVAQPLEPWSGVRDALEEGGDCTQFDMFTYTFHGIEDSLYLNIYSPKLPSGTSQNPQLPVMVWIHGGGFMSGSGSSSMYGPDFLVDEEVILVTINYRLGVLGFLCLNDPCAPGNVGLKDQVAALRWIRKNIAAFGGNPNNVTIFGESAGSASVNFHMMSPMSKGLFSRAIAQSGAAINPWTISKHPRETAVRLAEALGFKGDQPTELVDFLKTIDHMVLVKAATESFSTQEDKDRIYPPVLYSAVVEVEAEGVERFLPASPMELLEEGRYHALPYMTGVTEKEGIFFLKLIDFTAEGKLSRVDRDLAKGILQELRLPKNYKKTDQVMSKIRHYFLKDKPITMDNLEGFVDLFTDLQVAEGFDITIKKMAQLGKAPLYQYNFSYDGKLNFLKAFMKIEYPGASHADELGYLFRPKVHDPDIPADSPEALVRARMVKLWTNFAKTGNPTPDNDPLVPVKWQPFTAQNRWYLNISDNLTMNKNLLEDRMKFWEELYRTL